MFRNIAFAVALAGLVAGCGNFQNLPGQTDQTVLFAGDAGLGCAIIPIAAPNTVAKAREAIACVNAVLAFNEIDLAAVQKCATTAGVPNEYAGLIGQVIARVKVRVGGSIFPKDSVGAEAVKAFVASCSAALG